LRIEGYFYASFLIFYNSLGLWLSALFFLYFPSLIYLTLFFLNRCLFDPNYYQYNKKGQIKPTNFGNQIPLYQPIAKNAVFESDLPETSAAQNQFFKVIWGNRRYVVPEKVWYNIIKTNEDKDPNITHNNRWNYSEEIKPDQFFPYNPKIHTFPAAISNFPEWGTPSEPDFTLLLPVEVYRLPSTVNTDIAKDKLKTENAKAVTKIKDKVTSAIKDNLPK
jgi:hypothetical protein